VVRDIGAFKYDAETAYRSRVCMLVAAQNETDFGDCTDRPSAQTSATLFLWGDSHAAHLYPGVKRVFGADAKLVQLTASNCPPIVGYDQQNRPNCKRLNDYIFERIRSELPTRVIVAASWQEYRWRDVADTLRRLHDLAILQIELVGPMPRWKNDLPRELYRQFAADTVLHRVPTRMKSGLVPETFALDTEMQRLVHEAGVNYVSPVRILCNLDGCLARLGDKKSDLISWDAVHLTKTGSEFLVSHFPPTRGARD
jgi:SGNH domain (fused to AT3 domains)